MKKALKKPVKASNIARMVRIATYVSAESAEKFTEKVTLSGDTESAFLRKLILQFIGEIPGGIEYPTEPLRK